MAASRGTSGPHRAPPALAYALGVMALWVQLSTTYDSSNAWTYWHAATMATKPIVAGLGFGVLLRALTFSLLVGGGLLLAWWLFQRFYRKSETPPLTIALPLICLTIGGFIGVLGGFALDTVPTVPNLRTLGVPIVLYLLFLCWPWFSGPEIRSFFSQGFAFYPKALYNVVSLLIIVLIVFLALFPGDLQLPCLTRQLAEGDVFDGHVLTAPRAEELEAVRPEGRLVANADGYWWVFDENGRFTAIPRNDQARMVIDDPFGEIPSRDESNYSGSYREAPYNPIQSCRGI